MRTLVVLGTVVMLCLVLAGESRGQVFTASLDGDQETPPVFTPATGSGMFTLTGGPGSYVLTYSITYSGLLYEVSDAHIHQAAVGVPGSPVHHLDDKQIGTTSGTMNGNWRFDDVTNPLTDALVTSLMNQGLYVNIHTNFPTTLAGEIRGQIVPEPGMLGLLACCGLLALGRRRTN